VVLTGAHVPDVKELESVLRTIVGERPQWDGVPKENLDNGYYGEAALAVIVLRGYIPHVVPRGTEKQELAREPGKKARRWVRDKLLVDFSYFTGFWERLIYICLCLFFVNRECRDGSSAEGYAIVE
jgi:hypothetical protein